jgi:hypothetical protein
MFVKFNKNLKILPFAVLQHRPERDERAARTCEENLALFVRCRWIYSST